ncbi:hypothetical protein LTR84_008995 [Exophiala bonariae]|uniref:Uncharacterized protein n=1 Tax=Exophiala bonariae TaxID=1690606 RepID=A0AAV9MVV5_9EURO|nr:hypothetical protein LTR84_008995 [Exophiala bonariae]
MADHANAIYAHVRRSSESVQDQINNIAYVKTLAPFEIHPTSIDIWCNYRQMLHLIVKHTMLPCRTELVFVEHLAHIFDAHVYHPFLLSTHMERRLCYVETAVNLAYDAIMTLLHKYRLWCKAMKDVKQNHLQPVLHRIQNSPDILQSIRELEAQQEAAKAVMRREHTPGTQPLDARARLALEQTSRSKQIPAKTKTKFRREQTI